ncbi:MAG: response regulator [Cyclobacteriaceae bacterium]|nr:response regulator [Cyclobacteriaceae bacterium]
MNIRVLIIEDNPITAMDLQELLETSGYVVIGKEKKAEDALKTILMEKPDVIIVDIKLVGEMDGITMVEMVREIHSCPVIYLTANSDKATVERAIRTSPAAFITKPFQSKDVSIAIEIAFNHYLKETANKGYDKKANYVFLKSNNTYNKVKLNEITHAEAQGSYCKVYTTSGEYMLSGNLSHFITETPPHNFLRIHRSHIVNIEHIDKMDNDYVYMGKTALPIGRKYKTTLKFILTRLS